MAVLLLTERPDCHFFYFYTIYSSFSIRLVKAYTFYPSPAPESPSHLSSRILIVDNPNPPKCPSEAVTAARSRSSTQVPASQQYVNVIWPHIPLDYYSPELLHPTSPPPTPTPALTTTFPTHEILEINSLKKSTTGNMPLPRLPQNLRLAIHPQLPLPALGARSDGITERNRQKSR